MSARTPGPFTESWEQLLAEELGASDAFEEPLDDLGVEYEDWEELAFGAKDALRDEHRWELDPASAEDFLERNRGVRVGPSWRWRHFGH